MNGKVIISTGYTMESQNFDFFFTKFEIRILTCDEELKSIHLSFVNISPTLVINTSMERSPQVLATARKPKKLILFKKKCSESNFDLCLF